MKKLFLLLLLPCTSFSQVNSLFVFNHISGYIEIHDEAYFERMDNKVKELYKEHIGYFNKAADYYNISKDYESAFFYFDKAFKFSVFDKQKVKPEEEIIQEKALRQFLCILKMKDYTREQFHDVKERMDKKCDPERKRIAYTAYEEWKNSQKK